MATERERQRLQQEQAVFQQRLEQDARWFRVRLAVGYGAVVALLAILGGSGYVLLSDAYGTKLSAAAGTAVFGDMISLFIGVWKVALKGVPSDPVEPTTALKSPDK